MPPDRAPADAVQPDNPDTCTDVGNEVVIDAAGNPHDSLGSGLRPFDARSTQWTTALGADGPRRDEAIGRLHELLLRIARSELHRRSGQHPVTGQELDDLAHQAAADALVAIIGKLDQFRGESRFTTWAYRFVILEVSTKLGRHFWQRPTVALEAEDWDRLPDRFGVGPADAAQRQSLIEAIRSAVNSELSDRQRTVFVAIVLNDVPLDAVVVQLNSNRNAIYKIMFDARRKLRVALAANGHLDTDRYPAIATRPDVGEGRRS
jgi:RNA polymerase sigma-70 factor (ECF subfamily)